MQLSLEFEPGLTARYRRIEDCIANAVSNHRGGAEKVAAALDMAPSELSRRLTAHVPAKEGESNNRPLRVSDFVEILRETGDYRPIYWLIETFLRDPEIVKNGALQQLAQIMPAVLTLCEQAGITVAKGKR